MKREEVKILLNEQLYNILKEEGYVFLYSQYSYGFVPKDDLDSFLTNDNKYDPYRVALTFSDKALSRYSYFPNLITNKDQKENKEIEEKLKHLKLKLCFTLLKEKPQLHKIILDVLKLVLRRFTDFYNDYFDIVGINKEKFIYYFNKIGLTDLDLNSLSLKEFFTLTKKHQLNDQESQDLLIKFLKNRDKQLKNPLMSVKARDNFLSYFEHNEKALTPYFSYFPLLEKSFKKSELNTSVNIFQQEYDYTAYVQINYSTMFKNFGIEGWTQNKYQSSIPIIVNGIILFYDLTFKFNFVKEHDLPFYNITILHNTPHFNQVLLKKDIINFFRYLYENPSFDVTNLNVKTWFQQFYLSKKLSEKGEDNIKKTKL